MEALHARRQAQCAGGLDVLRRRRVEAFVGLPFPEDGETDQATSLATKARTSPLVPVFAMALTLMLGMFR